ncbi:hypothetical protein BDF14DRAFT_1733361 [Spinellus fusiger]|nr:hypothetical protein BDF14DRAFT_1733361 [Spinellus fusiger]
MHQEYPPKVQPRSSSTRHGQPLMPQNTLDFKALLDYTSLDKVDAEAGCILIQLANHSPVDALTMPPSTNAATTTTLLQAGKVVISAALLFISSVKNNSKCSSSLANSLISTLNAWNDSMQSDPIMLLAAAAEARNPRTDTNSFSWQYLSMKQNPKIKRNAMHAYITYMIYTDMVDEHSVTPTNESMWYSSSYSPVQERPPMMNFSLAPPPSTGSIMARPLTAFLWEDASTKTSERKHEGVTLPPLSSRSLSHVNTPPANGTFQ